MDRGATLIVFQQPKVRTRRSGNGLRELLAEERVHQADLTDGCVANENDFR
jgi:hypothetical protein